jgi:hypothetical protein
MQRYLDRDEIPGIVTLIARRGRVVHCDSIGHRDVEARTASRPKARKSWPVHPRSSVSASAPRTPSGARW